MAQRNSDVEADSSSKPRQVRSAGFWFAACLLLLCLYVASIGPVWLLTDFQLNGHLSRSSFNSQSQVICETFYWPICKITEQSPFLSYSMSRYLGFWRTLFPK